MAGPSPAPPDLKGETFAAFATRAIALGGLMCPLILALLAIPLLSAWFLYDTVWGAKPISEAATASLTVVLGAPLVMVILGILPGAFAATALVLLRRIAGPLSLGTVAALVPVASLAATLTLAPLIHALIAAALMTPVGWLVFSNHQRFRLCGFFEARRFDGRRHTTG